MASPTSQTVAELLRLAAGHGDAGRVAEAETIYRGVLADEPAHPHALHLLGLLLGQRGDLPEAVELLSRAAAAAPGVAEHHSVLGEMCRRMERLDEAIAAFARAIELSPGMAETHNNFGNALRQAGRADDAVAAYQRAVELRPDYADAWSNLGNALRGIRQLEAALDAHRQAVRLAPGSAPLRNNFGIALMESGRIDKAIVEFSEAIRLRPGDAEATNNLGNALRSKGQNGLAVAVYRKVIQLKPDSAEAFNNLGGVLRSEGRLDEAYACHGRALQLKPDSAEACCGLGGVMADQGRLDEAIDAFRMAIRLDPVAAKLYSPLLFTLNFHPGYDARQILAEHREWSRRFAEPLSASARPHDNDRSPDRKLRIGYVSPDFRRHPVGRFLVPLLAHHNHADFEIFCYSGVRRPDDLTERLRRGADHWRQTTPISDEALAEQIRQDRIDVLVDLTMHMTESRLLVFARRPAPVQVTWLAYVGTTGLEAIDYRLSDPYLDPPDPARSCSTHSAGPALRTELRSESESVRNADPTPPAPAHAVGSAMRTDAQSESESVRNADPTRIAPMHSVGSALRAELPQEDESVRSELERVSFSGPACEARTALQATETAVHAPQAGPLNEEVLSISANPARTTHGDADSPPEETREDGAYAEETFRLPRCYWCYEMTDPTPDVGPLPALQAGHVTFACFNNFCKVTAATLSLWARLLQAVPRSRLLLHGNPGAYQQDVRQRFSGAGVSPDRIEFIGFQPLPEYLRQHNRVDIALDPFPYGGGTTSCDSLWMGVPVVALAGRTAVGRSGVSLLSNLGLPELIAATPEQYVAIAAALAGDLPSLARLRAELRPRMQASVVMDGPAFTADMEAAFREMWRRWCGCSSS